MFKTISIALFGLVLVIFEPCVTQNMTGPCPKYANQPNLELTKVVLFIGVEKIKKLF